MPTTPKKFGKSGVITACLLVAALTVAVIAGLTVLGEMREREQSHLRNPSLEGAMERCTEDLMAMQQERDDWARTAMQSWKMARELSQQNHLVDLDSIAALHKQVSEAPDATHRVVISELMSLYIHAPEEQDPYLILITYRTAVHEDTFTHTNMIRATSGNLDRCVFTDSNGSVDQANHMQDDEMPEHPNGPQTFNAATMTGLEEAEYWQKECARLVAIALNN